MSQPWMPLYIADYLADTSHLRALESGAYLHLIMHYWQQGSLPDDDRKLSTIAKMTDVEWRRHRPTLILFFKPGWKHPRIEKEIVTAAEKYRKRVESGRAGGRQKAKQRAGNQPSNASFLLDENGGEKLAKPYQPQPQTSQCEVERDLAGAHDPGATISAPAFALSKQLLTAIRADQDAPEWYGFAYLVQAWLTLGCSHDLIMRTVTYAASRMRSPNQRYLDTSVRGGFEDIQSKPAKTERQNGKSGRGSGLGDALDQLRESIAADERGAQEGGSNVIGLLPHGRRA